MKNTTVKTYEDRCDNLAKHIEKCLDKVEVGPSDDLGKLAARIQADQNLADYKFKFRQADHVHQLLYGPWAISVATFVLALTVGLVSIFQPQKERDTQASLVLKVLAAPPGDGKKLLNFLTDAGLLKLNPTQEKDLEALLPK